MGDVALAEIIAAHVPWHHVITEDLTGCSCGTKIRFDRDEDGNRLKDGAPERRWAEHVAEEIRRTLSRGTLDT